jgi:hypothetical protein
MRLCHATSSRSQSFDPRGRTSAREDEARRPPGLVQIHCFQNTVRPRSAKDYDGVGGPQRVALDKERAAGDEQGLPRHVRGDTRAEAEQQEWHCAAHAFRMTQSMTGCDGD